MCSIKCIFDEQYVDMTTVTAESDLPMIYNDMESTVRNFSKRLAIKSTPKECPKINAFAHGYSTANKKLANYSVDPHEAKDDSSASPCPHKDTLGLKLTLLT